MTVAAWKNKDRLLGRTTTVLTSAGIIKAKEREVTLFYNARFLVPFVDLGNRVSDWMGGGPIGNGVGGLVDFFNPFSDAQELIDLIP